MQIFQIKVTLDSPLSFVREINSLVKTNMPPLFFGGNPDRLSIGQIDHRPATGFKH
jgi:hypothetical protein